MGFIYALFLPPRTIFSLISFSFIFFFGSVDCQFHPFRCTVTRVARFVPVSFVDFLFLLFLGFIITM
jgi:hypothetical protein